MLLYNFVHCHYHSPYAVCLARNSFQEWEFLLFNHPVLDKSQTFWKKRRLRDQVLGSLNGNCVWKIFLQIWRKLKTKMLSYSVSISGNLIFCTFLFVCYLLLLLFCRLFLYIWYLFWFCAAVFKFWKPAFLLAANIIYFLHLPTSSIWIYLNMK